MKCPYCKNEGDKVIDSRSSGDNIRRRRECTHCSRRFTTYEYVEMVPLVVIKRDGSREPFKREKLLSGILTACKKRPISIETIEKMVQDIEVKLMDEYAREISYEKIGEIVMENLYGLDSVAYVRFASVYRQFKDAGEFVREIRQIR